MENILLRANAIVNERSEEKDRQYGPFGDCMERATRIYNELSTNKIYPEDMYKALIALKLAREAYKHKEDNLLDAVAYIGALNNYLGDAVAYIGALNNYLGDNTEIK